MTFQEIDRVIQAHLSELRKPNVLAVRPGYRFTGGWITRKPAVVTIVDRKRDVPAADSLPPSSTESRWMYARPNNSKFDKE
jgi:hypothetical protein